jgi:hypothetical protein
MGENTIGKIFPALREIDMLQYGEHGEKSGKAGKRESGNRQNGEFGPRITRIARISFAAKERGAAEPQPKYGKRKRGI